MTNAAAVIGLTFNSHDLQEVGLGIFLEIMSGLHDGLEVRGTDTVVPGAAGRISRNRVRDRRVVQLRGFVTGNAGSSGESGDRSSFRDKWQTLEGWFPLDGSPANLVASLEDGSTATLSCRTTQLVAGDQPVPSFQLVTIQLESVSPNWS